MGKTYADSDESGSEGIPYSLCTGNDGKNRKREVSQQKGEKTDMKNAGEIVALKTSKKPIEYGCVGEKSRGREMGRLIVTAGKHSHRASKVVYRRGGAKTEF